DVAAATEAGKSLASGAVKGVVGMPGLPGNLETLGRHMINAGGAFWGAPANVVEPQSLLPTSQHFIEHSEIPFYEPQTRLGRYSEKIGEFAPGMTMGGPANTAARALTNVIGPAVGSEAAGELTKGMKIEPYSRVAGALV